MALEIERILADEQLLVIGEAIQRVAAADAHATGIVEDADDRRRETRAAARIPRRAQRRIEPELMMRDRDPGDATHSSNAHRRIGRRRSILIAGTGARS